MVEQKYYFKISPENIKGDLITVNYTGGTDYIYDVDPCCPITAITENTLTGSTGVYTGMTYVLSGASGGTSILTGLTIPILLTQTGVDYGYYSVFDGAILQKEVITNFMFSATTGSPYTYYFYNTSDLELKKFLELTTFKVDWGDGTTIQTITGTAPLSHNYPLGSNQYTITMTATSPWGISQVSKTITDTTGMPYLERFRQELQNAAPAIIPGRPGTVGTGNRNRTTRLNGGGSSSSSRVGGHKQRTRKHKRPAFTFRRHNTRRISFKPISEIHTRKNKMSKRTH
jgi:hypothetical protein